MPFVFTAYPPTTSTRHNFHSRYSMIITINTEETMDIHFTGPLFPTDPQVSRAFMEILNILLLSGNIVEVNSRLINRNIHPMYRSLSGHFRWSFANDRFTLWQRTEYNSDLCFINSLFEIHFASLVCKDRRKINAINN